MEACKKRKIARRSSAANEEISREITENITRKCVYAVYDCQADENTVTLGEMTIQSVSLARHLKGSRRAVLLAVTLGINADVLIKKYSVQDMEKTLIAQYVLADMIEDYLDEIEEEILHFSGYNSFYPRFSPGYGDFDIKHQKDILRILQASRIGISLTEGYMMIPSKSVTAILGFSPEDQQRTNERGDHDNCGLCAKNAMCAGNILFDDKKKKLNNTLSAGKLLFNAPGKVK